VTDRGFAAKGLAPITQFAVLLRLRIRLGCRILLGSTPRIIAFLLVLLLFVPLALVFGIMATLWAAAGMPNVVHYLFLVIYVYVLVTNLFGIFGNEFMDTSKLFPYPVSPTVVFLVSVAGNLFAPVFLFFMPSLVGLLIGLWSGAGQALFRILFLILFWLLTVASSQVVALISMNTLKTRRCQDLVRVIAPLTGLALYLGIQVMLHGGGHADAVAPWMAQFPRPLKLLPSYWISTLFLDFGGGRFPVILAALAGSVFGTALLFLVGGWLQNRAFYGEIAAAAPRLAPAAGDDGLGRLRASPLALLVPDPVRAVAWKEYLIYRREPGFKTIFVQQGVIVLLFLAMMWLYPRPEQETAGLFFVVGFLLYVESALLLNQFGPEGRGLEHLLLRPTGRDSILVGKNLAAVILFGALNTALIFLLGFLLRQGDEILFVWVFQLAALVVMAGFGNWTSVVLAWPMFVRGRSVLSQGRTRELGCVRPLLALGCMGALVLIMAPLFLLAFWGRGAMGTFFLFPFTGISFAYALILYTLFLRVGTSLLCSREENLISLFTQSPE